MLTKLFLVCSYQQTK